MNAVSSQRIAAATVILLLSCGAVAAQLQGNLSGPVLGYVVDARADALRPVKGILGSATVGPPVDAGIATSQLLVLDPAHAIASTAAGVELLTLSLDAQPARAEVPGVAGNPSRSVVSRQGTSVAFYYSGLQEVRIVTGLPKELRYAGSFQVDRPLIQMAVDDDGTLVVYATSEPDGQSLYAWTPEAGSPRFLTNAVSISGIALTENRDAIVADRGVNEVFAIWDVRAGAIRRLIADEREGVSNPAGVAISSANRIYVANAGSAAAIVLDSSGRYLKTHSCGCSVSGLYPLRDSMFRLTDAIDQTIFVLDASSAEERIMFVPPPLE